MLFFLAEVVFVRLLQNVRQKRGLLFLVLLLLVVRDPYYFFVQNPRLDQILLRVEIFLVGGPHHTVAVHRDPELLKQVIQVRIVLSLASLVEHEKKRHS